MREVSAAEEGSWHFAITLQPWLRLELALSCHQTAGWRTQYRDAVPRTISSSNRERYARGLGRDQIMRNCIFTFRIAKPGHLHHKANWWRWPSCSCSWFLLVVSILAGRKHHFLHANSLVLIYRKSREAQPINWKLPSFKLRALHAPQTFELITDSKTTGPDTAATATNIKVKTA